MNKKRIGYQGKKVYVGMDVHYKTYAVTAICDGEIVKRDTLQADSSVLVAYLKKYFQGAKLFTVYESGFSGFNLHRALVGNGIQNIVINPASLEVAANDKVKTDRRDSKKLAEQLSVGRLHGIFIPDQEQELKRQLTRTREQIVRVRARTANQIKSKLHYFGLMPLNAPNKPLTNRFLKEVEKLDLAEELSFSIRLLIAQWRFLTLQLVEIRKKLQEQSQKDFLVDRVYRSVPGIGLIGARVLSNELGDLSKRFQNERELFSFTGLTPTERSSGETVHRGHISRQGAARVRYILIEAAWWGVGADAALRSAFERIAQSRGKKRAIVAIARKLIGKIRACFATGELYRMDVCM